MTVSWIARKVSDDGSEVTDLQQSYINYLHECALENKAHSRRAFCDTLAEEDPFVDHRRLVRHTDWSNLGINVNTMLWVYEDSWFTQILSYEQPGRVFKLRDPQTHEALFTDPVPEPHRLLKAKFKAGFEPSHGASDGPVITGYFSHDKREIIPNLGYLNTYDTDGKVKERVSSYPFDAVVSYTYVLDSKDKFK